MRFPSGLPSSFYPPEFVRICPLANFEHASIHYNREECAETGVRQTSIATAQIAPRGSLTARFKGAQRTVEALDSAVTVTVEGDGEDPVLPARRQAAANVLFQHLATNCLRCPAAENCGPRELIAESARAITYATPA